MKKGFTLIELMVVISIISLLASIIMPAFQNARNKAYMGRAMEEFHSMYVALTLYQNDNNGNFPPDVSRGVEPPGLGQYLSGGWPPNGAGPWPGSVYDWDTWTEWDSTINSNVTVYQIDIRFCDANGSNCNIPSDSWAKDFTYLSSVYYCISGPCKPHQPTAETTTAGQVWGYCMNCNEPKLRLTTY